MKKIIAIIVAVLLVASLSIGAVMMVSATDDDPIFVVSEATAKKGDTVDVTISLKNNPGIASIKFSVAYPSDLSIKSYKWADSFTKAYTYVEDEEEVTADPPSKSTNKSNPANINWVSYTHNVEGDGDFVTIKFTVAENAELGDKIIDISYDAGDIFKYVSGKYEDQNLTEGNVAFKHTDGKITVVDCFHEHTTDYPAVASTCKVAGHAAYTKCNDCGKVISGDDTPLALAEHTRGTAVSENVVPATCGANGSHDEVVYCTVCNTEISREPKTYLATGKHTYEWKNDSNYHWQECSVCNGKTDNESHTAAAAVNENVVPATCGANGSHDEVVYCSVCGYKISSEHKTDLATGKHTAGTPVNENVVPATCGADGSHDEVVYCTVCNTEISREPKTDLATGSHNFEWKNDSSYHWQECTVCHSMPDGTESEEHKFEMKTVEEPTFEKEGLKKEVCTVCGYESGKTEKIDKLEKVDSTPADDTTNSDGTKNSVVKSSIPKSKLNNAKIVITVDGEDIEVPAEYYTISGDENGTTVEIKQSFYATNPKFEAGKSYTATIIGDGVGTTATVKTPEAASSSTTPAATTTDNTKTTGTTSSPKTADTDIAFLIVALLAVMGSSVFAGVTYRRKKNSK